MRVWSWPSDTCLCIGDADFSCGQTDGLNKVLANLKTPRKAVGKGGGVNPYGHLDRKK